MTKEFYDEICECCIQLRKREKNTLCVCVSFDDTDSIFVVMFTFLISFVVCLHTQTSFLSLVMIFFFCFFCFILPSMKIKTNERNLFGCFFFFVSLQFLLTIYYIFCWLDFFFISFAFVLKPFVFHKSAKLLKNNQHRYILCDAISLLLLLR